MVTNIRDRKMIEEALEKGIKKGREEGREARNLEIICNMLDECSIEEIAKFLKLPIEKIEKVRDEYLYGKKE